MKIKLLTALVAAVTTVSFINAQNTFPTTGPVGIGTSTPNTNTLLNVRNGTVLFDGTTGITPVSGAGTRMMWIPSKAAFRFGTLSTGLFSGNWDAANVGSYSFAGGINTRAFGQGSFAMGSTCYATGDFSVAMGNASAGGTLSIAMGYAANTDGNYSVSIGNNLNPMGYAATTMGSFNVIPGSYSTTAWVATDPLFVIGNGVNNSARSNAMTIQKNGNVCFGSSYSPSQKVQIDNGNMLVRGTNNFQVANDQAFVYLGDASHYIKSKFGYGVSIGTNTQADLLSVLQSGKVTIGGPALTNTPGNYRLYVTGGILTERVKVAIYNSSSWADFVFAPGYHLRPIDEVESYILENKHLPDVPSTQQVMDDGLDLAKMDATLLRKIEELTLYMIELKKDNDTLKKEIAELKNK